MKGGKVMEYFKLKNADLNIKLFVTLFLCIMGLSYLTLIMSIAVDTGMKVTLIKECYAGFGFSELVEQAHKYIFWFLLTFSPVIALFLGTGFPAKLKTLFVVAPMLLIISDIGSMWLIHYANPEWFCWQLYFSGLFLAVMFLLMFLLINYDIWLRKVK